MEGTSNRRWGSRSSRSSSLPEVLQHVRSFPPFCSSALAFAGQCRQQHGSPTSGRATSSMRGGFAPLPRGVNVPLSGETWSARGHAATTCNVIADVTGALPNRLCFLGSKASERRRSGIGSSAIVVRGSSGVSTPGAPRGRRQKVSSVGAFSSCVSAAKAPSTRERASRRHRRPHPFCLPSAGSNPDRTPVRMAPLEQTVSGGRPERPLRVGRGLEGSCCLVLAEGRFDDRSEPSVALRLSRPVSGLADCR